MTDLTSGAKDNRPVKRPETVVATFEPDALRSFFHLLVGKPDSQYRMLERKVTVQAAHLHDLHRRIIEKLENHHLDGVVNANAEVTFRERRTVQFGTWAEFERFRWENSNVTTEIRLTWNFLLRTQGFQIPQKHTLVVKMAADGHPMEFLKAVLTAEPDDLMKETIKLSPVIARVDFISHVLAEELLGLVDEWNKSLPSPDAENHWMHKLGSSSWRIQRAAHYLPPVLLTLLSIAALRFLVADSNISQALTLEHAVTLMQWLLGALLFLFLGEKLSKWLGQKCKQFIDKYGRYCMFQLTSGDFEEAKKMRLKNRSQVRSFLCHAAGSFMLNVAAGVAAAILWPTT